MTVQDLINKLNQVEDKTKPVVFTSTDHTDWTWVFEVEEEDLNEGEVIGDGMCDAEFEDCFSIQIDF